MTRYNNSIENASNILSLFTLARSKWGTTEVSKELGISKTTTHNILATLEKIGFLKKNEDHQKYELGKRIASLGALMAATSEMNQKAAGLLQELATTFGLSTRLGIWDSDAVIIIFSGFPLTIPQHPSYQAGPRVVAYSSAIGRAILAHMAEDEVISYLDRTKLVKFTSETKTDKSDILEELAETRERGYSICDGEVVYGSAAIGFPVFDGKNRIAGAITCLGKKELVLGPEKKNIIGGLSLKAMQISQSI